MAVAERTDRELSLVLPSEGCHRPMRDEPPLRWVSPWDLSSELFTLDDAAEGMEREKLSEGFTATLEALNQAKYSLGLASRSLFSSSIFFDLRLFSVSYCSQPGEILVPLRTQGGLGPPHQ